MKEIKYDAGICLKHFWKKDNVMCVIKCGWRVKKREDFEGRMLQCLKTLKRKEKNL